MKIVVLVGDGMGDYPVKELGDKSPLQAAHAPMLRKIAAAGEVRMVQTVPEGLPPGSDVANMALMGYNALENYTGRAPIEAAGADITMNNDEIAFRCNLVTVENGFMKDYSAGHISTDEASVLISALHDALEETDVKLYTGVQYRHLLIWKNGPSKLVCNPPHEIADKMINDYLPKGFHADALINIMEKSKSVFSDHPVNKKRIEEGKLPATQVWLWGQGGSIKLDSYQHLYGLGGGVISAVDLLKGLAKLAGLSAPNIEGATGLIDTNYAGKVSEAINILQKEDFAYLHIEAPDECGHMGDALLKTKAIELFDQHVCVPMIEWLQNNKEAYVVILCMDHRTPVALRGHTSEPVPMAIMYGPVDYLDQEMPFDESINNGIAECMACDWIREILKKATTSKD